MFTRRVGEVMRKVSLRARAVVSRGCVGKQAPAHIALQRVAGGSRLCEEVHGWRSLAEKASASTPQLCPCPSHAHRPSAWLLLAPGLWQVENGPLGPL